MSSSRNHLSLEQVGASRAAMMRVQMIIAAGYFFYGYWFSQRRA